MIDGLIAGKLQENPVARVSKNGNTFVTTKVRVAAAQGESIFANVIAFDDKVKSALLALEAGDSVSIAGTLTPKAWLDKQGEPRPGLDIQAHAVLTAYAVRRKRETIAHSKEASDDAGGEAGAREDADFAPMEGEGL